MRDLFGSLSSLRRSEGFAGLRRFFFPPLLILALLPGCEFRHPSIEETNGLAVPGERSVGGNHQRCFMHPPHPGTPGSWMDTWTTTGLPRHLTFSGPDGVTRGWEDLRIRYLNSYWAPWLTPGFSAVRRAGGQPFG